MCGIALTRPRLGVLQYHVAFVAIRSALISYEPWPWQKQIIQRLHQHEPVRLGRENRSLLVGRPQGDEIMLVEGDGSHLPHSKPYLTCHILQ